MGIKELERIAMKSQKCKLEGNGYSSSPLEVYEDSLKISVKERVSELKKRFPKERIIAGDFGCCFGTAVGDLNKIEGIEGFGLDIDSSAYNPTDNAPIERFMIADLNEMPHVPSNSFHWAISYNTLSYTDPKKSFLEIYRVLKKGGIADIELEGWLERNFEEVRNLDLWHSMKVVGVYSGFKGDLEEYLEHLKKMREEAKDRDAIFHYNRDVIFTRFELRKK